VTRTPDPFTWKGPARLSFLSYPNHFLLPFSIVIQEDTPLVFPKNLFLPKPCSSGTSLTHFQTNILVFDWPFACFPFPPSFLGSLQQGCECNGHPHAFPPKSVSFLFLSGFLFLEIVRPHIAFNFPSPSDGTSIPPGLSALPSSSHIKKPVRSTTVPFVLFWRTHHWQYRGNDVHWSLSFFPISFRSFSRSMPLLFPLFHGYQYVRSGHFFSRSYPLRLSNLIDFSSFSPLKNS